MVTLLVLTWIRLRVTSRISPKRIEEQALAFVRAPR